MKPSKAAQAMAEKIMWEFNNGGIPEREIASIIDEGNKDLVDETANVIKACRYQTPAINRVGIANRASEIIANYQTGKE